SQEVENYEQGSVCAPPGFSRHFCIRARALEVVGERWSLLIVRALLLGPQRFTDLVRSLPDITPTRLTNRLRQLESAGVVTREPPTAGRGGGYRLRHRGPRPPPGVGAPPPSRVAPPAAAPP